MDLHTRWAEELDQIKKHNSYRTLREIDQFENSTATLGAERFINLSSNDYLGIAHDVQLRSEFKDYLFSHPEKQIWSAASSRLLTGNHEEYREVETLLSTLYRRSALYFNSGYHANIGILPALSKRGDLILSDKLNHASIIDGLRLCEADFKRYNHLNYEHLEKLLIAAQEECRGNIFIISESIFSMDGDEADLKKLVSLKQKYNAFLIIDEAHSVGVRGDNSLGLAEESGVLTDVDIIVGTFGKAFGSCGAYGIMDEIVREYLVNKMRSLIFTTGLPPAAIAWSSFVLRHLKEFKPRRQKLQSLSDSVRQLLLERNLETCGSSQIIPIIVHTNEAANFYADKFRQANLLAFAIRPPTVPPNSARLRLSLSAALPDDIIAKITDVL